MSLLSSILSANLSHNNKPGIQASNGLLGFQVRTDYPTIHLFVFSSTNKVSRFDHVHLDTTLL